MRVLFATTHVHFPQGGGGLERSTHELCLRLREAAVAPGVMSKLRPDGTWLTHANRLKRFLLGQAYPRDAGCGYPCFRAWGPDGVPEVVRRFRPDLAVCQSTEPAAMLARLGACEVPAAVYVREVEEVDHFAAIAARGVTFIANSNFTAARLRERCGIEATVVPPLVDPAHDRLTPRRESVLFVNTTPRKGVEVALQLAERRPGIPFGFVRTPHRSAADMAGVVARAKAAGNVILHQPVRDMRPLYARARIVLIPSQLEEAKGRMATEAQVNGIPVLASNRGGLPESVGPGGILLPHDAPIERWLEALDHLWEDDATYARLVEAAQAHAARPAIQPDAILMALIAAFEEARGRGARPIG